MRALAIVIASLVSVAAVGCQGVPVESKTQCLIVKPARAEFLEGRAATELQKYAQWLTGVRPETVDDSIAGAPPKGAVCFVIGPAARNRLTAALAAEGRLPQLDKLPAHAEGFAAAAADVGGAKVVVLAGRNPIGSLYAVYDYLETSCGVGFFQDGEHVPQLDAMPADHIARAEQPRFDNRLHLCWNAHRGLKKYHSYWWTADEWKRELDWMVKRRLNLVRIDMGYYSNFAGDAFIQAFPEIGPEKEERLDPHLAGWPVEWGWPPEYKRAQTREMLDSGRKLSIRFVYGTDYGTVPFRFKEKHPDFKYLPGDQYGESRQISPYDPMAYEVTRKYLAKIIDLFGTDHLYMASPFAEIDVGGGDDEKNLDFRIEAAKGILRLIDDVDKQGTWVTDTWDLADSPQRWNEQRVKRYMDSFPDDKMYLYETAADVGPVFQKYGYWHGKRWAFGVINAFAGKEVIHANIDEMMERLRQAAACKTCTGLFMVPELTHANVMWWDLVTRLAWHPEISFDEYLKDFVVRRYGRQAQGPMLRAWKQIVQAVHSERGMDVFDEVYRFNPWYQWKPGAGNCPLFSDTEEQMNRQLTEVKRQAPLLKEALAALLAQHRAQTGSSVYVEDVVVLYRTYAGKFFDIEAGSAYSAFKAGDKASLANHSQAAMAILRAIQDVLAVCPSYSINKTIAEACSVKGHNSLLPETIRQNCLNQRYTTNDVYEQFGGDYIPRTGAYFDLLATKIAKGESTVALKELEEPFRKIDETYRMQGWSAPAQKGDPVARVAKHFAAFDD